ncbi:hypothetical protein BSKO_02101 [Bryopsis sp. KO-2023]|nr:hypothetical protein BSKO_02101 [Bryopsis sp. KO-2023]
MEALLEARPLPWKHMEAHRFRGSGLEARFRLVLPWKRSLQTFRRLGNGQAVKMCNQVFCGVHMLALCEAMALAEKQGLDPKLITKVCSRGAAGSWALANLGPMIIDEDYAPGFMIKHMQKDLRLVQATAEGVGQDMPGTSLAQQLFSEVEEMGGQELGTQAMIKAFKEKPQQD